MKAGTLAWRERFENDSSFRERERKRVEKAVVTSCLEGMVAYGQLDPKGKTELEIWEQVLEVLKQSKESGGRFVFAIDHTAELRALANEMHVAGNFQVQALLLATWVEHVVNHLIALGAHKRGIKDKEVKQIIRDTSLSARLSWLLQLLGFPAIPSGHYKALLQLAEWRNSFVHYKWSYDESNDEREEVEQVIKDCAKSIRYMANYWTRHSLRGSKKQIRRLGRGTSNSVTP